MATYGVSLHFDGYPVVDTSNLVSIYPLGTYFKSDYNSNSAGNSFASAHPRSAPNGAAVYINAALHGRFPLLDGVSLSNTGISGTVYGRYQTGCAITTWADCRNVAPDGYGLLFSDGGVNTALSHGGIGNMRVVARRTYSIPASNFVGSDTVVSIPELQKDLRGYQDLAVFIGVRTRDFTPIGTLTPINGYASGANLTVRFIQSTIAHGAQVDETYTGNYGSSRPALTLYVLVCAAATNNLTGTHGIAIYNDSGNVSLSSNNVPVFGKGTFNTMALSYTPRSWIGTQSVPANLQSTDLILLPVGGNVKGVMSYVNAGGNSWKRGRQIFFFSGNTIKAAFGWNNTNFNPTTFSEGYMLYISFSPTNTTYMGNATPVMMLDGNDYFV